MGLALATLEVEKARGLHDHRGFACDLKHERRRQVRTQQVQQQAQQQQTQSFLRE